MDDTHNNAYIKEHAEVSDPGVGGEQSRAKTRSEEQGGAVLNRDGRIGPTRRYCYSRYLEVFSEDRVAVWEKNVPGRGNSQGKGPEAGMCLAC